MYTLVVDCLDEFSQMEGFNFGDIFVTYIRENISLEV